MFLNISICIIMENSIICCCVLHWITVSALGCCRRFDFPTQPQLTVTAQCPTWRSTRRRGSRGARPGGATGSRRRAAPSSSATSSPGHHTTSGQHKSRFLVCNRQYLTEIVCQRFFTCCDKIKACESCMSIIFGQGPSNTKHIYQIF